MIITLEEDILYFDTREPPIKKDEFEKLGYIVEQVDLQRKLGHGDYYYKNDGYELLFERKSSSDFDGSMVDNSLFYQAEQMNRWLRQKTVRFRLAYVLMVGTTNQYNEYANVMAVGRVGAMASVMARYYPIPVTPLTVELDFNWFIHKTIRCAKEDTFGDYRPIDLFVYKHPGMNLKDNDPRTIYVNILRILGLSKTQAENAVDLYNIESIDELNVLDRDDLDTIKGIGEKTIIKILNRMGKVQEDV